ncbi:sulfurtransferase [Indiicoccus explosivorum]|uniref:sulfurtransferase n=1 Tax=Indiicoccus explosivorum TaxID=1917864 RepID=UPI001F4DD63D|nr:sulfurtransferase [Indiicoccus explosivorum]
MEEDPGAAGSGKGDAVMTVWTDSLGNNRTKWIDARFDLSEPDAGRRMFEKEHIKGAVFWDLEKDLSDMAAEGGRHPMPSDDQLTALIRRSGLNEEDEIIIYDQGGAPYAARAWWLLKYAGFPNAAISRNGFEKLKALGAETTSEMTVPQPSETVPVFNRAIEADREDVKEAVAGREETALIDARSEERYRGFHEPIDPVAGRIPGARNFDWSRLVEEGEFRENPDFTGVIVPHEKAILYCGSGVTAAALFAAMTEAGHDNIKLYAGSYSDWISDETNTVEFDRPAHPEAADDETKALLGRLIAEGYSGEMLMKKFEYEKTQLNKEED